MALDHHPVQNSEVYLLHSSHAPSMPPPSPPSPATPCDELSSPLDGLGSMTPPEGIETCSNFSQRLSNALHVLSTEATSLSCLTMLYETDPVARGGFNSAVEAITRFGGRRGKLIVSGVGKSGHIGVKLVATLTSLKIPSIFLHPTEALHGDLGTVDDDDTILLISNSGKTGELLALLPHFHTSLPTIIMTSHTHPANCEVIRQRPGTILLPAPIHISETDAFGVNAPTISTTMALALGDALAIAVSRELHSINLSNVFLKNHPGGAIGAAISGPKKLSELAIPIMDIPEIKNTFTASQVVLSAYQSECGWVRQGGDIVVSPRRIKKLSAEEMKEPAACVRGLTVPRHEWVPISADMDLAEAKEWIKSMRRTQPSKFSDDNILVTMDEGEICGVMEIGEVMA
ncbi:hypothetical protein G7Y89_g15731 [Cudoniella acicularis]|uniref:SIS domain-containing protein n=1 Tax=Cudoniella acicularis TaxID=354080 RepID=A0A8H4QG71_9HELO|nr:hypothetical protein G7Y89_g15731 [Cudoniella acicularis]